MQRGWLWGAVCILAGCGSGSGGGATHHDDLDAGPGNGAGGQATGAGSGGASAGGATSTGGVGDLDASAGGAGSADSSTSSLDELSACLYYVDKSCERYSVCGLESFATCDAVRDTCPDAFFSPGSTRTPGELVACADTFETRACPGLPGLPACARPGTRQVGEPCVFSSQCETLACSSDQEACGKCGPAVGADAPCNRYTDACPVDQYCEQETTGGPFTCGVNLDTHPITKSGPGGDCNDNLDYCVSGTACVKGTCQTPAAVGEPCAENDCAAGEYCGNDYTCAASPALGQPCANTSDDTSCAIGATCDAEVFGNCVARLPAGSTCTTTDGSLLCIEGTTCLLPPNAATRLCGVTVGPGEACDAPGRVCIAGSTCVSGKCRSTGQLLGYVLQLCGQL